MWLPFAEHLDRPSIMFTCREDILGNHIVQDDSQDDEDVSWWPYFDPEKPKTKAFRGQTYPDNLPEMIEAAKEADRTMNDVRKVITDLDDLFEESEGRERDS
jgi:hypothetical protein